MEDNTGYERILIKRYRNPEKNQIEILEKLNNANKKLNQKAC
jgi:hypothetical protein